MPIGSSAAVRLVGWYERDSGYIDNVANTLTYPATASSPTGTAATTASPVTRPSWT